MKIPKAAGPRNGNSRIAWWHASPAAAVALWLLPPHRDQKQIVTITILQSVKISASRNTKTDRHRFVSPRQGRLLHCLGLGCVMLPNKVVPFPLALAFIL